LLDGDLGIDGLVTLVDAPQQQVETEALRIVRAHGLRAMDARDEEQRAVAEELGFTLV